MPNAALDQLSATMFRTFLPLLILAGVVSVLSATVKGKGRRQRRAPKGSLADDLVLAPWWVSLALAGVAVFLVPVFLPSAFRPIATIGSWFFVAMAILSAVRKWKTSQMLDEQTSLESICSLSSKRFEDLVGEAYRRRGYNVTETLSTGADGGVDLVLTRNGETLLVQCKRWLNQPVPVQTVRELFGVLHDRGATAAKLVTTSRFTPEAKVFAAGKPIELVGSGELLRLIGTVQKTANMGEIGSTPKASGAVLPASSSRPTRAADLEPISLEDSPHCPQCNASMVKRKARRGANAGKQFWGCPTYPRCRGTRPV